MRALRGGQYCARPHRGCGCGGEVESAVADVHSERLGGARLCSRGGTAAGRRERQHLGNERRAERQCESTRNGAQGNELT